MDWFKSYLLHHHYVLTGVADILPSEPTVYAWGKEALDYKIRSKDFIKVLRRVD